MAAESFVSKLLYYSHITTKKCMKMQPAVIGYYDLTFVKSENYLISSTERKSFSTKTTFYF